VKRYETAERHLLQLYDEKEDRIKIEVGIEEMRVKKLLGGPK
jgi:hypothetical protein